MKTNKIIIQIIFACLVLVNTVFAQTGPKKDCIIAPSFIAHSALSVPSVKSGKLFTLSLSVPGPASCDYLVSIETTDNLVYVPTAGYPLPLSVVSTSPVIYNVFMPGAGISNPDYSFKFKPGETCNGEKGTFKLKFKRICGGVAQDSCETQLDITAEAQNYWTVKKEHIWGDMKGGMHVWRVRLEQTPHTLGEGDYNIYSGLIKDAISPGPSTIITGVVNASGTITGLGTANVSWNTGTISSYNSMVDYYVYSTSCENIGTTVTNCVNYDFCLCKKVLPFILTPAMKTPGTGPSGPGGQMLVCCDALKGTACDNFALKGANLVTSPITKVHLFGNTCNYSTGCEGMYQIAISNNANVPITNLDLTDNFPAGITVTSMTISGAASFGSTPNLSYDLYVPSGGPIVYTGNTSVTFTSPAAAPFSPSFAGFRLKTTSGSLSLGSIIITIRFRITAPAGAAIKNCATLQYTGNFSASSANCNVPIPPVTGNTVQSCDQFIVQSPKAIPLMTKCILGTNSFQIGDEIPFQIVIANHGGAGFFGNLHDFLGSPQNLEFVPGSDTYSWGPGSFNPYSTQQSCYQSLPNSGMPSFVTTNFSDIHDPKWSISNMPGDCDLYQAQYLVIKFKAKIKPTNWGPYTNTASLAFIGGGPVTASASYNVIAMGDIKPVKLVNNGPGNPFTDATALVDPGNPFQFSLRFLNNGSVDIKTLSLIDMMPTCVTGVAVNSCKLYPGDGSAPSSLTVTGTFPNLTFPPAFILKPGDMVEVIVNATAASGYKNKCCNDGFKVQGINSMSGIVIENQSGPACISPLNCCNIANTAVSVTNASSFFDSWLNLNVKVTTGPIPIQEVTVALIDYHVEYNYPACKPATLSSSTATMQSVTSGGAIFNIAGSTGLLQATAQQSPLRLQNAIQWELGNPLSFSGGRTIPIRLLRPGVLDIPCCNGVFYYCLKVTIKDVNCNTCEKIVCSSANLFKPLVIHDVMDMQQKLYRTTQPGKPDNTQPCQGCTPTEKEVNQEPDQR